MDNKNSFQVLVVEPNNIGEKDWAAPDYIRDILDKDYLGLLII